MNLKGYTLEQLSIGMQDNYERTVTDEDIHQFAQVSGDHNPVHLDAEFAAGTRFKARIAHGMLSAAFISTVVGTKLPGPGSIYVSQSLKFRAPVYIGDTVITTVTVTDINERKGFVTLNSTCSVEGKDVVRGESVMMVAKASSA
ncbi:MAG: 3-hydroxybutyryl-CoA dehydratase [Saprospiraceae bacterium]|jgi:3-hydroxybutyryl-CoA dehydratase